MIVARGKKTGILYMTSSCRDMLAAVDVGANSSLWHCRLGHLSEKGMKMLVSNEKLPESKIVEQQLYESCIFGKQKNVSFSNDGRDPKAAKLELVHTDVWGSSPVTSLEGSRYYVSFIDGSSRKVWIYFLKNKSDVYETFERWKAMVENDVSIKWELTTEDGVLKIEKIPGSKNPPDMLTKVVIIEELKLCLTSVGLLD